MRKRGRVLFALFLSVFICAGCENGGEKIWKEITKDSTVRRLEKVCGLDLTDTVILEKEYDRAFWDEECFLALQFSEGFEKQLVGWRWKNSESFMGRVYQREYLDKLVRDKPFIPEVENAYWVNIFDGMTEAKPVRFYNCVVVDVDMNILYYHEQSCFD